MADADIAGANVRQRQTSESVARSAGITSAAVLASRVTGLAREVALASFFGASAIFDAFLLGFRIPNLTRDLFAEGALSSAFVPTFVEHLNKRGKQEAAHLANLVATAIILIVGGFSLAGMIFAPQLVEILAPGFKLVPGKFELAVRLTRIMFPFLLLVALAAQVMGILNACNQFALPALSSSMFNVTSVLCGLTIGYLAGPYIGVSGIEGMAWGVLIGGAVQLGAQIPSLIRQGFIFRPTFDWTHPGLQQIGKLMGPAILGNAAVQINVAVNSNFASQIVDPLYGLNGPVSWLAYAFRLMQLPIGLFGVAVGTATLPAISRSAATGEMDDFRRTISRSLALVLLLTIPSSVGLAVLGQSIIGALFERGQFGLYDTQQTGLALSWFALGLAGYSGLKVLVPAFYALGDSRTPMLVSLASIAINFSVVYTMTRATDFAHAGLALSTSAVANFGSLVLFSILRNRTGGIYGRALLGSVVRILLASSLMAAGVYASSTLISHWLPAGHLRYLVDIGISLPFGVVLYAAACKALKIDEVDLALSALARPLERLRARIR